MADGSLPIVVTPEAFGRGSFDLAVIEGLTVRGALVEAVKAGLPVNLLDRTEIYIDGARLPREVALDRVLKAGELIHFVVEPLGGGGGGGKDIGQILVSLAVLAVSSWIGGMALFASNQAMLVAKLIARTALQVGVLVGGAALVSSMGQRDTPARANDRYALQSASNQYRQWGTMPLALGEVVAAPDLAVKTFTQSEGDDVWLYGILGVHYGPCEVSEVKIGDTLVSTMGPGDFRMVQHLEPGPRAFQLYPNDVDQLDLQEELQATPGSATPLVRAASSDGSRFGFDFFLPAGLHFQKDDGRLIDATVSVAVRYRPIDMTGAATGPWQNGPTMSRRARSKDPMRITHWVSLPHGRYEFELTRSRPDDDNAKRQDRILLTAIKAVAFRKPVTDETLSLIEFAVRASAINQGGLAPITCRIKPKCPTWTGSGWGPAVATSNPAALARWLLTGPAPAKPLLPAQADLRLRAWSGLCEQYDWKCHVYLTETKTQAEVLQILERAGRAWLFWDGVQVAASPWVEKPAPRQLFTGANLRDHRWEIAYPDPVHALRVEFLNLEKGGEADELFVYADGYGEVADPANGIKAATLVEALRLDGQATPNRAYRDGRWALGSLKLQRRVDTWTADIEHLVSQYGDRVRLAWRRPLNGAEARVRCRRWNADGTAVIGLRLTQPVRMEAGLEYAADLRTKNGLHVSVPVETVAGETREIRFADPRSPALCPQADDLIAFGVSERVSEDVEIVGIEPGENLTAVITGVRYVAPQLMAGETGPIPALPSRLSGDRNANPPRPTLLGVQEDAHGVRVSFAIPTWRGAPINAFTVRWRGVSIAGETASWAPLPALDGGARELIAPPLREAPIEGVEATRVEFEITATTVDGRASRPLQVTVVKPVPGAPLASVWSVDAKGPDANGVSQPILIVRGEITDPNVAAVRIAWGLTVDGPWTEAYEGAPLTKALEIGNLTPGVEHFVAITHLSAQGVPSQFLVIGPRVPGQLISGDTTHLKGEPVQDVLDRLTDTATLADENRQAVEVLEEVYGDTASAATSAAAAAASEAAAVQAKADALIAKAGAESSAGAAQTAKTQAETARAGAETAQTSAANSATTATGAAATATTQAGIATTAKNDAQAASSAAVTAKDQASSFADAAGVSAGASQASSVSATAARDEAVGAKNDAEAARGQAQTAASAAATSASSAAASETAAGQSASAATTAKTQAETARGQAQTAATQAASSRDDAAGSAASASSSATNAANSRDAAAGSASAAAGSASTASTKANEAGISAASALSSQVSASTARDEAMLALLQQGRTNLVRRTRATAGQVVTTSEGLSGWGFSMVGTGSDAQERSIAVGPLKQNTPYSLSFMARRLAGSGSKPITFDLFPDTLPERAFDIQSNAWTRYTWENFSSDHSDMTMPSVLARFFRPNMEADVNVEIAAVKIEEGATATVWTPSPFDAADSASAAATSASSAAASETAAGQSATAASGSATTAATKAGEASTFASQASTSAANANTAAINAGVSATSAASRAGGNIVAMGSFSDGTIGTWTGSVANVAVSGVPDGSTRALRSTGRDAYEGSLISGVWGGRRLRVSGYGVAPGPYPLRIGIHGQTAANGSHWVTMAASSANTNSWATFSGEIVVPADVNRLRPFIQSEGPQSATDHHVQVATLRIEDVTESASAANSAAVATSQAASASASAASAQISADLVASVNNQSGFNILPNSTFAEGFAGWSSSSWLYTTTAPVGPHAYVNLNGTNGLDSDYISINASLTYVLSADFRRLATSGNVVVDLACYGNTGGVLGYSSRAFVNTNTNFGEGARRFVKITSFPAGTTRVRVRVFGENLTGIQTNGAGVRQIKLEVGDSMTAWRDDSQLIAVDARASLALSTSVDAVTRLGQSAFELILAAGGSPAYIKALAGAGGSEIALAATELLLRNVVGDQIVTALKLINGEAYFGAPVSVDISGRRLTIGPGFGVSSGLVLWFGPNTIALSAMSRTNGYFAMGTDGKVYYGSAELSGGGGFHAQASAASRIGTRTTAGSVTTATVTITTTGATGSVSYDWSQIGGEETWTITAPSGPETAFRVNVSSPGEIKRAQFACLVRDAGSGRAFTIPVGAAAIFNV
ncbi:TipJ family phage tail tip protein [Brevundimonas naejangsanensis]|uniref:TipJ family phage tail tip protein n=1 Tax=Brevundimonas naejangsanensis TaxID=588932 RepID=UPI0034D4C2D0